MTFNVTNTPDDQTGAPGQPSQQPNSQDQGNAGADTGITPEKILEILKRDEHAQQHILKLENENKTIRENFDSLQTQLEQLQAQLASQKKVEELLTRTYPSNNQPDQGTQNDNMNTPTTQNLDQATIDSLIAERMKEFMSKQEQEKNYETAKTELSRVFKDKSDEHVRSVAAKNGLTYEAAETLAKTNPTLFNNLFVVPFKQSQQSSFSPTLSNQSTSSVPNANAEITMESWNKLRRENPRKWQAVETQKAFHTWFHNQQSK